MSTIKNEWNEHLQNMYSNAFEDFRQTDLHCALNEQLKCLEQDCKSNFREDDLLYITAWIEALLAHSDTQCIFMYKRGYQDCIGTLQQLDVI